VQTFYRGDHNNMRNGEQHGAQNRGAEQRGAENRRAENHGTQQPQTQPQQRGTTVRGAQRPQGTEHSANNGTQPGNERREK